MPKQPKQTFGNLDTNQRALLTELIKIAASVTGCTAATLAIDEKASAHDVSTDHARSELGMELGRLNATISNVMSMGIADSDFALQGMTREQQRFRAMVSNMGVG